MEFDCLPLFILSSNPNKSKPSSGLKFVFFIWVRIDVSLCVGVGGRVLIKFFASSRACTLDVAIGSGTTCKGVGLFAFNASASGDSGYAAAYALASWFDLS